MITTKYWNDNNQYVRLWLYADIEWGCTNICLEMIFEWATAGDIIACYSRDAVFPGHSVSMMASNLDENVQNHLALPQEIWIWHLVHQPSSDLIFANNLRFWLMEHSAKKILKNGSAGSAS